MPDYLQIKGTLRHLTEAREALQQIERALRIEFPIDGDVIDYNLSVGYMTAVDHLLGMVDATVRAKIEKMGTADEPAPALNLKTGEVHPW